MTLASRLDHWLYARGAAPRAASAALPGLRWIDTPSGRVRVQDSGGSGPAVLLVPDGPCVIEHYAPLVARLTPRVRVVVADLPGFGFSVPGPRHDHRLRTGAEVLLAVLSGLGIERAVLALSCVNGYYGIAAAHLAPQRVTHLLLSQTPGMPAMRAWTERIVPAPIRVPVLGQLINFAQRRKVAAGWYRIALARREDRPHFQYTADRALADGGCYCFAGVVQGMQATAADDPLLAPVPVPATLLWGGADRSHRPTDPEGLRAHLPQLTVQRFEQAGHFPDLEAPEAYAAVLLNLLFPDEAP